MSDHILEISDLTKVYSKRNTLGQSREVHRAVDGLDLHVSPGETVAIVGESGAGKSTVGRIALGLIPATSGSIRLLGTELCELRTKQMRTLRSQATMIFQDPFTSMNPRRTVLQAITEPLEAKGERSSSMRRDAAAHLLERVGLTAAHLERYPYELSGGQLQRIAIARALITEPKFIVCDEPVAALDVSTQAQVINLLRGLQQERGIAMLFISHDLRLVRTIADRVTVMRHGQVIESGKTKNIYQHPTSTYTRSLLESIPAISPRQRRFGLKQLHTPVPHSTTA